jgi:hypothetical protein
MEYCILWFSPAETVNEPKPNTNARAKRRPQI